MRRHVPAICTGLALILLSVAPADAGRKRGIRESETAIQPVASEAGLVLFSRSGSARIESADESTVVALGDDERLTTVAETAGGWTAAGVRQQAEGSAVFFVAGAGQVSDRLPAIARRHPVQLLPVLLVNEGELLGAAWLEGETPVSLAVHFAEWTGAEWSRPATVARPGPGSQTGLTGVALRDGRLLLVWSRHDGNDDELYWSARGPSGWSRPARVAPDNRAPDIIPRLAGDGREATLIWARRNAGEYQLMARRFTSDTWGPESVIGPPGSLHPTLIREDGGLFVIFRTARPRGWSVAEFDEARVAIARSTSIPETSEFRPILREASPSGIVLDWNTETRPTRLPWQFRRK